MSWDITDYSGTPSSNTAINGISIAEGCNASNVNDAIRQMMADIATQYNGGPSLVSGDLVVSAAASRAGCLLCNGAPVSRTTYAPLFVAIGTAFGVGDGSTTFNLPDYQGRTIIGAGSGSGLTARSLGQTGGQETHVLTLAEVPSDTVSVSGTTGAGSAHSHGITDPGHAHLIPLVDHAGVSTAVATGSSSEGINATTNSASTGISVNNESAHTHTVSASGATNGSGGAHNNMQPFGVANVFIKT